MFYVSAYIPYFTAKNFFRQYEKQEKPRKYKKKIFVKKISCKKTCICYNADRAVLKLLTLVIDLIPPLRNICRQLLVFLLVISVELSFLLNAVKSYFYTIPKKVFTNNLG